MLFGAGIEDGRPGIFGGGESLGDGFCVCEYKSRT